MANYHPLRDQTLALVDSVFAERVRHSPMRSAVRDPDRLQQEIMAPLRSADQERSNVHGGYSKEWLTKVAAARHVLKVNRAGNPDVVFRDGDVVRAIQRPGQPAYTVVAVDDRQHTRLVIYLGDA